jgi:hypothetical protein
MKLTIPQIKDFSFKEKIAHSWDNLQWQNLSRVGLGKSTYKTAFKIASSQTGLYVLVSCEDKKISCTDLKDFHDIYNEDVVEIFLWPNEKQALYFEYEISPLGVELPLLVPNHNGDFMGWLPWHYEGARKIRKMVTVDGGKQAPASSIRGWTVQMFIPFVLFRGLGAMPPGKGAVWKANVCRMDYDLFPVSHWTWSKGTSDTFHNFRQFGSFVFE